MINTRLLKIQSLTCWYYTTLSSWHRSRILISCPEHPFQ